MTGGMEGAVEHLPLTMQCCPGSIPELDAVHCMWVGFVVGSLLNQYFQITIWQCMEISGALACSMGK